MALPDARKVSLDVSELTYRQLNAVLRQMVSNGVEEINLHNVYGQRYIGTDLDNPVTIEINGVPGNDLGAFMDGPRIIVRGNAQDGCGNTMNGGEIVIHGHAGDATGLSARGGKIFVRDSIGYRGAIHMKEYGDRRPVLVVGGSAQDFFGEYIAGGTAILLGLNLTEGESHKARFLGTGMHGGVIYLRGSVDESRLGREVGIAPLEESDFEIIRGFVAEFATLFGYDPTAILEGQFIKLVPRSLRPYGRIYAY
ncbi:MAG: hypothetical protein ACLFPU_01630 [Dehalococcoidia bacterium]